ncbi:glucuronyl/N-acetylglucosaminyl transferase EXT2 [Tribonema minus]|uniref:Glucuronyl/N-acetylglucosaminyl transferase EXT2 n=1 Tax=Tribonema minus TaxID=303371 RepID=A0A835YPP3_9STRA|nr:glucuronyl/N-acetylglucosaminyl transferase EXT2 [Tribonema minus]
MVIVLLAAYAIASHLLRLDFTELPVRETSFVPGDGGAVKQFSVRVNTYKRNENLKRSVEVVAKCPSVASLTIVWSEQENDPPPLDFFAPHARPLISVEKHTVNSLNNRFRALTQPTTEAVFSMDDDVLFRCQDLAFAFDTWKAAKGTMVGFHPRLVTLDRATGQHRYRSWWYVWRTGAYNMVLTKAAFFHRDYLETYFSVLSDEARAYVDATRNCDDVAMAALIAHVSGAPPIWVEADTSDLGVTNAISASRDHFAERGRCLDFFVAQLGGASPFRTAQFKAVRAKRLWWFTR